MRQIKFRAWDKETQHMEYDFDGTPKCDSYREYALHYIKDGLVLNHFSRMRLQYDPKYYCLMQYTGLKDKNGVEIYEGDVVRHCAWENTSSSGKKSYEFQEHRVIFWQGMFTVEFAGHHPLCVYNDCEIIGNIHQNPELLEQE